MFAHTPPAHLPIVLLALLFCPGLAPAQQDRRGTLVPGLVLDAGGRHGSCDALLFTPGGKELLAAGDDKVVRTWAVAADGTLTPGPPPLRWPSYREQRGSIFTADLSPDARRIAIGGFGMKNGLCAVLDRATGALVATLQEPISTQVTWIVAFDPSGKYVVLGDAYGQLFRWETAKAGKPTPFAGSAPQVDQGKPRTNRARFIAFVTATRFVAVCQDGAIREWDITRPTDRPTVHATPFKQKGLLRVTLSGTAASKTRWLAGFGDNVSGTSSQAVEVINLTKLRAGAALGAGDHFTIRLPRAAETDRAEYPSAVAFDARAARLAVGTFVEVAEVKEERRFARTVGGFVRIYDLAKGQWQAGKLSIGYRTDNVTWRPGYPDQLATAGGPNHEVRTWALPKARLVSEVRTPGSGLWAVAFGTSDRYIAWRDRLNTTAPGVNARGAGPWRVFDLKGHKLLPEPPKDFAPLKPIEEQGGWRVEATKNGYEWRIVGPQNTSVVLNATGNRYPTGMNQLPRCYAFLPRVAGKPVRLAVGHMWGVSLYELRPGDVRLARLLTGHEGEVMALAPSRDGKLLLTASRDQTLCCWSLVDWPERRELGVSFRQAGGKVQVKKVVPGSPGWETDMTEDDELVGVISLNPANGQVSVYNPSGLDLKAPPYNLNLGRGNTLDSDRVIALLDRAQPGREYILIYRDNDAPKKPLVQKLTSVRQRPLWRLFPTRASQGGDWVLWRWRDFYYATASPRADKLLGWHVNLPGHTAKPRFHPLEGFRGSDTGLGPKAATRGFNRPDKVWPTVLAAFQTPEKVTFEQIEPPEVRVRVLTKPGRNTDLVLEVVARPYSSDANQQNVTRVMVWLDDHLYGPRPAIVKGAVNAKFTVPRGQLRHGPNRVTLMAYNAAGGRGSDAVDVEFDDGETVVRDLHALCVGVSDYSRARHDGEPPNDLTWAAKDAADVAAVLKQHEKSVLYRKADARLIAQKEATAARIEKELRDAAKRVGKDDLFILFLAGHGEAVDKGDGSTLAGSYFYVCADSDTSKPESTCLTSQRLYALLAAIPCRKLVILDSCRSGAVDSDPLRDLTRDDVPFIIMSACKADQKAAEPRPGPEFKEKNGFFTLCLLEALGEATASKGKRRARAVMPDYLRESVQSRLPQLLKDWNVPLNKQTPVYLPERLPAVRVLARP